MPVTLWVKVACHRSSGCGPFVGTGLAQGSARQGARAFPRRRELPHPAQQAAAGRELVPHRSLMEWGQAQTVRSWACYGGVGQDQARELCSTRSPQETPEPGEQQLSCRKGWGRVEPQKGCLPARNVLPEAEVVPDSSTNCM